jgi:amino acid permease
MFANLFLLFFGSGTFAMPWGFARAGVLGGALGVCVVAGVTFATISMLVATKRRLLRRLSMHAEGDKQESLQRSLSYASIASHALGTPVAGSVVKAATTFSSLGACGGYLTFVTGLLLPMVRAHKRRVQGP